MCLFFDNKSPCSMSKRKQQTSIGKTLTQKGLDQLHCRHLLSSLVHPCLTDENLVLLTSENRYSFFHAHFYKLFKRDPNTIYDPFSLEPIIKGFVVHLRCSKVKVLCGGLLTKDSLAFVGLSFSTLFI